VFLVHTNVNGKKIPLKLFLEWGEGEIMESAEGGEFKYDIFDIL
jgi:hypothetical protein